MTLRQRMMTDYDKVLVYTTSVVPRGYVTGKTVRYVPKGTENPCRGYSLANTLSPEEVLDRTREKYST